jgi:hypothetical protein
MIRSKNEIGIKLLIMGFAVGLIELYADHAAVTSGTLIYNPNEPFLASSPLYMPLVWLNRMVQIGYIGMYLLPRIGMSFTCIATAILGGIILPIGEWVAHLGGFWVYHSIKMISNVPIYIIVCEFLTFLFLIPVFSYFAKRRRGPWQLIAGIIVGLIILLSGELGMTIEAGRPYFPGISGKLPIPESAEPLPWEKHVK